MQLNNLVIIPIPYSTHSVLCNVDSQPSSLCKSLKKSNSLRDDIAWKKSVSAFKKFKVKKDKENKKIKNSISNVALLQQQKEDHSVNKNFTLVDNDIKFSLLNNQDYDLIKFEDPFEYFDPNTAPFFQFGVTYQHLQKENKIKHLEEQPEPLKLTEKSSTALKLKKQQSKKDKPKQQNLDQEIPPKIQNYPCSEAPEQAHFNQLQDPFIIIRAPQVRGQQLSQCLFKTELRENQELKKTKTIKKKTKYQSKPSSIYSREIYSRPRSEQLNQSENSSSEQKSVGYGNDQLPMIEFDFGRAIGRSLCHQDQNGIDNLPIYESKEPSQIMARIKPYQNSIQIFQEYEFNPEFVRRETGDIKIQQIEQNNAQGLQKA